MRPSTDPDGVRPSEKNKPKLWLAMMPAVIVLVAVSGIVLRNTVEFGRVTSAIIPGNGAGSSNANRCVETYAVTLHNSEYYVREFGGIARPKDSPRELSTVIRGMARNVCSEPLQGVRIRIHASDDNGKTGSAWAPVGTLAPGQVRPFERAWIGRVTSYRLGEIR